MPSPVSRLIKTMDFSIALEEIIAGKKVTKLEWKNPEEYAFLKDGFLCLRKADGTVHTFTLRDVDITGRDWVVVLEN